MSEIQLDYRADKAEEITDVADYWALLKPRVMQLVILTALVGMIRAGSEMHPVLAFTALLCISVGAGASGALNMWFDADIDRIMTRTANRPVASGRMRAGDALAFGLFLSVASVLMLGLTVSWFGAAALAFTIFFYAVIYTMWLKRATSQNIVIGGLAGALPPLVAWVSITDSFAWEPLVLVAIIFMWTPAHFWALALYKDEDYRRANVPMLPVVHGRAHTKHQIVFYAATLLPLSLMPTFMGWAGIAYGVVALVTSCWFFWSCFRLYGVAGEVEVRRAKKAFGVSIIYLFAIFIALLVDGLFHVA